MIHCFYIIAIVLSVNNYRMIAIFLCVKIKCNGVRLCKLTEDKNLKKNDIDCLKLNKGLEISQNTTRLIVTGCCI